MEVPLEKYWPRNVKLHPEAWLRIISVDERRPLLPDYIPDSLRDIIERAWNCNPDFRPSATDILTVLEDCIAVVAREV